MRAFTSGGPQVGRRLTDARNRREWELQQIATPRQATADYYAEVHRFEQEREKRWAAETEERRAAIAKRHDEIERHNKQVTAQRTHDALLAVVFEQYGATEAEQKTIKQLVGQRPLEEQTLELCEYLLLQLRAELDGTVPECQPDWRSAMRK